MDEIFNEMLKNGLVEFKKPDTEYEKLFSGTRNLAVKIEQTDTLKSIQSNEQFKIKINDRKN